MKQCFFLFLLTISLSCSLNKKDLIGKYYFQREKTKDSLIIKEDIYIHKIYNNDLRLMYTGSGSWSIEKDRITLLNFYNNEDNGLEEPLSSEDAKKFLMITSYPVFKQDNEIIIEVNSDEEIFYKKK